MIVRKNCFVRIRVIDGSGIFDKVMNIARKPIVQKLLASAGKSMASALGGRLVASVMAPTQQLPQIPQQPPLQVPQQLLMPLSPQARVTL
jgi:hypothetical protein